MLKVLKAGTLVGWRGSVGIILGKVEKIGACPTDVWVKWTDETDLKWENGMLLEVLNESR
tara:strand:- start:452 stop:631 length:180 start_codon:yes stop_codon:yes gene_type:complete